MYTIQKQCSANKAVLKYLQNTHENIFAGV